MGSILSLCMVAALFYLLGEGNRSKSLIFSFVSMALSSIPYFAFYFCGRYLFIHPFFSALALNGLFFFIYCVVHVAYKWNRR